MKFHALLLGSLITFALAGAAYAAYLALDGQFGRSYIKARRAAHEHRGYRYELTSSGGDCAMIGDWSDDERTCSLSGDVPVDSPIMISAVDITLDGRQHRMVGESSSLPAITVMFSDGVSIRNLVISGYRDGVYVNYATRNSMSNLEIHDTERHGISLENESHFNIIDHNWIHDTGIHGITINQSNGNLVWNNEIVNTRDAIRLQASSHNYIVDNFMERNRVEGLDFHSSGENVVQGNSVMELDAIPIISEPPEAWTNILEILHMGNRYAVYDEPAEGCHDEDGDGICDAPYRFAGGVDPRPVSCVDPQPSRRPCLHDSVASAGPGR